MALADNIAGVAAMITQLRAGGVSPADAVKAARDSAILNLAMVELQGPTQWNVNYSIDGRNYDFVGAKAYWVKAIDDLTNLMQKVEGPWLLKSLGI